MAMLDVTAVHKGAKAPREPASSERGVRMGSCLNSGKPSPTAHRGEQALGKLSMGFDFSAANTRRLKLFERGGKSGGIGSQKLKGRRKKGGGSVEVNSAVRRKK
jgi:hypothetical protein